MHLEIILPVFLIIGVGYVAVWGGLLRHDVIEALGKFTQFIAIPCLLFLAMANIDLAADVNWRLIVSYYFGAFCSFLIGFLGARIVFDRDPADAVAIAFCCFFSNTILLGIPISERAYGPEILANNYAIIAFHVPLCYLLGVTAMELALSPSSSIASKSLLALRAIFKNTFALAIFMGLAVNFSNLAMPGPIIGAVELLAQAALPAALFGLGGILVQYKPEGDTKTILMICAISLVLHPVIVLAAGLTLSLDQDGIRSAVLTAAIAPGINAYIFANMYGTARRVVATSVLFATALSIISVGIWLAILA